MPDRTTAPYGSWVSPISAQDVAGGSIRLSEPRFVEDRLLWLEMRPAESGRTVLVAREKDGTLTEPIPDGFDVHTSVHEYGGGSYAVHGDTIYFSNRSDQRLYRLDPGSDPQPITPRPPFSGAWRYADGQVTQDGSYIICVREHHTPGSVTNELVSIPTDGSAEPFTIMSSHDFFSSPRVSPDGNRLAWMNWDHPNMPWDGTELWTVELLDDGGLGTRRRLAGGANESILQPEWGSDGSLYWLSDRTGFWNLYRDGRPLAPIEADCGDPAWVFGLSFFGFLADGRIAMTVIEDGFDHVYLLEDGERNLLDLPAGTHRGRLVTDGDHTVAVISGSAVETDAVRVLDVDTDQTAVVDGHDHHPIPPAYISIAQPIRFPTDEGPAFAFFYEPHNPLYVGPEEELPPLLVFSHGGPTSRTRPDLNPAIQYWTSRGIAVVDVNYGGSSGYGRRYRQRLRGTWGIVDTRDCIAATRFLASKKLIDEDRLAIRGGSAGGFTTLAALTFHDRFRAGASYYGVADLEALARDTHKFESHYLDTLLGPLDEYAWLYHQRSPINFTDRLSCPLILFQGLEDEVVPPAQAASMAAALDKQGIPYLYITFEGEQHGFRKAENIAAALEEELAFYGEHLGFTPASNAPPP